MNIEPIIKDGFNARNLDKNQYAISIIRECLRVSLIDQSLLHKTQVEIAEILRELVLKFTKNESTSVQVEVAEKLIISIWYTVDAYLLTFDNIEDCIKAIKNESINQMYKEGKLVLEDKFDKVRKLYEATIENKINTGIIAYDDTIFDGINGFFENYDIEFEPHEMPGSIDYPLAFDDWSVQGINYIENYLWNLYIENKICNHFDEDAIKNVLNYYGRMYKIDYKDLLINGFEITITNAVFSIMCKNNSGTLDINKSQFKYLEVMLKKLGKHVSKLIDLAFDKLINELNIVDENEISYIEKYKEELTNRTISAIRDDNIKNLLVITEDKEEPKRSFIIDEENKLDDDEFKIVIEEIIESKNVEEKIEIIKSKINSIIDFIDVLESDCLFGEEFIELFKSLSEIELAILGKIVFNEECRMNTLDLKDVIFKEVDSNCEWEEHFIEFLRFLDDEKISSIGERINQI